VYTLVASIIVGTLLIYSYDVSTVDTKNEAEQQQIKNIAEYVAAKSCELVSATTANNLSTRLTLDIPPLVGNQRYWIQLENDSFAAWVQIGYGTSEFSTDLQVSIPSAVSASGVYVSDSGPAMLECSANSTGTYLQLLDGD